jgi:hypothetical protein
VKCSVDSVSAKCGVASVKCKVWSADGGTWTVEGSADREIRIVGSSVRHRVWSMEWGV